MCIIAVQPIGVKIKESTLKNCWDVNNDGVGIMYVKNDKIIVHKELHSFNSFMKIKKEIDKLNTNIVIHFRIATSGNIDTKNCHPFKVNDELYFCHNGILDIEVPLNSPINDTQIYNNSFLKGLPKNFVENSSIMQLIEYSIGSRNKFVFLDVKGQFHILNESIGIWDNGAWYSNTSYKSSPYLNYANYKKYDKISYIKDDVGELIQCESCDNMVHNIDINYDNYFDMYLCKKCAESVLEYDSKK